MRLRIFLVALGAITGVALGLVLKIGASGFFHFGDLRHELPPCFEVGAPFHHRFRPGCSGTESTPRGPVLFSFNEDGLRDRPRAEILSHSRRVLLVGDSHVEGWWVDADHALGSYLAGRFPGTYFVNAGLRSTGPALQATLLGPELRAYRPEAVIWVLNDTDGLDDRLACATALDASIPIPARGYGTPELKFTAWEERIAGLFGDSSFGRRIRLYFYENHWTELVNSPASRRCAPCEAVEAFHRIAGSTPIYLIYFADNLTRLSGHYTGGAALRSETLECLRHTGIEPHVLDFSELTRAEAERLFWPGDFHFTPEGMSRVADMLTPGLKTFFENAEKAARKP